MCKEEFMKKRIFAPAVLFMLFSGAALMAQENINDLKLSLKEAQDFALKNNKMVLTARSDVAASKAAVWETISSALPQISASGSITDNLKLTTFLLPGELIGAPGTKVPVTFGSQFNTSIGVQATMLIFNAPLYIGIETTKLVQKLSEQSLEKSELDTKESVSTAYFLILVSEKSLQILDGNLANLNETLKATKAMFSAGMAESTDVDQMQSNLNMVDNSRTSLLRTIEMNYNLLRFQLGVPAAAKITLTETLETLTNEINVESLLSQNFDYTKNIDYRLIEGQELMSSLALRSEKSSVLPTLAGYYSNATAGMGDKLSELGWYPNSAVGLQVSIPIFASGQRYMKIKQAQINLDKARTTKDMVTEQLLIQEKQLRYNLINANLQYKSEKDNVDVSKRVYASMENKFKQGMASSLDLTQSNSLYLQAENNYVSSLMNLLQTKLALDKLLNNM
jgi:outer membrane protein